MKKTALILIVIAIISKIIGFSRELVLAYFYGASSISDAYIIALTIPTVIFSFFGNAISTGYIPIYNRISKNSSIHEADLYTNNLINVLSIISLLIIILGLAYTEEIVKIFASGFNNDILSLTVKFTKISICGIFFTSIVHIFKSYLQIHGNYAITGLIGIPMSIVMIISIYLSSKGNTILLACGILISMIIQFVFLIPFVKSKGFYYKFKIKFSDPNIKKMIYLGIPVVIGVAVNDINKIVDRTLASQISNGAISALNYASQLNSFVQGIVVTSIVTAMYPLISKMVVQDNMLGLKKTLTEAINYISLLVIPASLGAMALARPIVTLLFGRGEFNEHAIIMTSNSLFFYAIGMIGVGLTEVLSRPFYAVQETKIPMIISSVGVLVNIVLNIILSKYLGIGGLALATSIAAILTTILMFVSLRKKIGSFGIKDISITFSKILFSSILMAIVAKVIFNNIVVISSQTIALLVSILGGFSIYCTLIYFMKIRDVEELLLNIKKKLLSNR